VARVVLVVAVLPDPTVPWFFERWVREKQPGRTRATVHQVLFLVPRLPWTDRPVGPVTRCWEK
jgi:hypothetical protein